MERDGDAGRSEIRIPMGPQEYPKQLLSSEIVVFSAETVLIRVKQ